MVVDLYVNGTLCSEIEEKTGISGESIKRWMRQDRIIRAVPLRYRPIEKPRVIKKGRYDAKFEEPINQGKFYSDYIRDGK